jgi:DNA (cytosine-5)-methyltransferase 1
VKLLDLFCGGGGASVGYHRAGFDVVGCDIALQPHYPFRFVQADALAPPFDLTAFDLIHASPPCQAYTPMANRWRGSGGLADERPDLVGAVRAMLEASGVPWVIENVRGAPVSGFTLTGEMFGLGVHRPRIFETSRLILTPPVPRADPDATPVYGKRHDGRLLWKRKNGTELRAPKTLEEAQDAMGIDWLPWETLKEAIPPAYTEWLGHRLTHPPETP